MLRRIKRFLGFGSRGAYFPNDEVAPEDSALRRNASRKNSKAAALVDKKEVTSPDSAARAVEPLKIADLSHSPGPKSANLASKVEEDENKEDVVQKTPTKIVETNIVEAHSPNPTVSDISAASKIPQARSASVQSLDGSGSRKSVLEGIVIEESQIDDDDDDDVLSIYSSDSDVKEKFDETIDSNAIDQKGDNVDEEKGPIINIVPPVHSECSSMCVNIEKSSSREELSMLSFAGEKKEDISDEELERRMQKVNEELTGILNKPPPFKVSTANLTPMGQLPPEENSDAPPTSENDDTLDNSVSRVLNDSHEAMAKCPESEHLRSFGY